MTDLEQMLSYTGKTLLVYDLCLHLTLSSVIWNLPCVQGWELRQPNSGGDGSGEAFEGPNLWAGGPRERAGQPEGMARGEHQTP